MATANSVLHGVVHGRTIELDEDPRLPDGQRVSLELSATDHAKQSDGLQRAGGSWKDMPGYDEWLTETYQARLQDRESSGPA
jgi:hypothetical protein